MGHQFELLFHLFQNEQKETVSYILNSNYLLISKWFLFSHICHWKDNNRISINFKFDVKNMDSIPILRYIH